MLKLPALAGGTNRSLACPIIAIGLLLLVAVLHPALSFDEGDTAIAAHYLSVARGLVEDGRWVDAESLLNQAEAFADSSSDLAYFLALVRQHLDRPAFSVLIPVRLALAVKRWTYFNQSDGQLLEAEVLINTRSFEEALRLLRQLPDSPDQRWLRLKALAGLADFGLFRQELAAALADYPFDVRFPRLFFSVTDQSVAAAPDRALLDQILPRLNYLLELDPSIAVLAVPFIADPADRQRLIAAYRAQGGDDARATVLALELGLIDERVAIVELFSQPRLRLDWIQTVHRLMRTETAALVTTAAAYSGQLEVDTDGDGRPESLAAYEFGFLRSFSWDADQDGRPELSILFADNQPISAELGSAASGLDQAEQLTTVLWSHYPMVEKVKADGKTYYPAPGSMAFAPVRLEVLLRYGETRALLFPFVDNLLPRLTEKSLVSLASVIERPTEAGYWERTELVSGLPIRTVTSYNGKIVSIMLYRDGKPSFKQADLDHDGRFETSYYFSADSGQLERMESDWDGDGFAEYAEVYDENGRTLYWDLDGDGHRERRVVE